MNASTKPQSKKTFFHVLFFWTGVILLSALAGGSMGWVAGSSAGQNRSATSTAAVSTSTSAVRSDLIPVEHRPVSPVLPSAFLSRRASAVLTLFHVAAHPSAEDVVTPDRVVGSAITLTSDGWLVTSYATVHASAIGDLAIRVGQRAFPIQQAVRDQATDLVFLKIDATDLPVTDFVSAADVVDGMPVWVEPSPMNLYPDMIVSVRERIPGSAFLSSDHASRRYLVSSGQAIGGGAVWDGSGRLVGILESKSPAGWLAIPAESLSATVNNLLSTKQITHASLGIRGLELSSVTVDPAVTSTWPANGFLLRSDRKTPAIAPRSPSAALFLESDVIDRVERDILDGTADIGERLLDYVPGTQVTISGERQGKSFSVTATLGSQVTSEWIKK